MHCMTELQQKATSLDALAEIERQVLWLSTAIVHHANRVRPNPGGLKVGGHQASSASMVSIMTSLWFRHLRADDRVSVKPHASPVLHAINYLLGELDESYLPTLRAFGGLQSYPSRVKDPDPVDYSTGSVGIGATAPVWGAVARRYLSNRFTADGTGAPGRQYSLLGDAELDEGAVWEAIVDPGVAELGEVVWVVDVNRQSLDRVVPLIAADRLRGMFSAAGWQVITLKYGRLLEELFTRPGGEALRHRIDAMPNPEYQRLLRVPPGRAAPAPARRGRVPGPAGRRPRRRRARARRPQPGRPRPELPGRGLRGHRRQPAHDHPGLHDQGLRPGRRGPPAEPLGAADRGPARRAGRPARHRSRGAVAPARAGQRRG